MNDHDYLESRTYQLDTNIHQLQRNQRMDDFIINAHVPINMPVSARNTSAVGRDNMSFEQLINSIQAELVPHNEGFAVHNRNSDQFEGYQGSLASSQIAGPAGTTTSNFAPSPFAPFSVGYHQETITTPYASTMPFPYQYPASQLVMVPREPVAPSYAVNSMPSTAVQHDIMFPPTTPVVYNGSMGSANTGMNSHSSISTRLPRTPSIWQNKSSITFNERIIPGPSVPPTSQQPQLLQSANERRSGMKQGATSVRPPLTMSPRPTITLPSTQRNEAKKEQPPAKSIQATGHKSINSNKNPNRPLSHVPDPPNRNRSEESKRHMDKYIPSITNEQMKEDCARTRPFMPHARFDKMKDRMKMDDDALNCFDQIESTRSSMDNTAKKGDHHAFFKRREAERKRLRAARKSGNGGVPANSRKNRYSPSPNRSKRMSINKKKDETTCSPVRPEIIVLDETSSEELSSGAKVDEQDAISLAPIDTLVPSNSKDTTTSSSSSPSSISSTGTEEKIVDEIPLNRQTGGTELDGGDFEDSQLSSSIPIEHPQRSSTCSRTDDETADEPSDKNIDESGASEALVDSLPSSATGLEEFDGEMDCGEATNNCGGESIDSGMEVDSPQEVRSIHREVNGLRRKSKSNGNTVPNYKAVTNSKKAGTKRTEKADIMKEIAEEGPSTSAVSPDSAMEDDEEREDSLMMPETSSSNSPWAYQSADEGSDFNWKESDDNSQVAFPSGGRKRKSSKKTPKRPVKRRKEENPFEGIDAAWDPKEFNRRYAKWDRYKEMLAISLDCEDYGYLYSDDEDKEIHKEVYDRDDEGWKAWDKQTIEELADKYPVDFIVGSSRIGKEQYYLVKFTGYPRPSWEPAVSQVNLSEAIEFEKDKNHLDLIELRLEAEIGKDIYNKTFPNRYLTYEEGDGDGRYVKSKRSLYMTKIKAHQWKINIIRKKKGMNKLLIEDWTKEPEDDASLRQLEYILDLVAAGDAQEILKECNLAEDIKCQKGNCRSCFYNFDSAIKIKCCGVRLMQDEDHETEKMKFLDKPAPEAMDHLPYVVKECDERCECDKEKCKNRKSQENPECSLVVFRVPLKGWTVRTITEIEKYESIGKYTGEVFLHSKHPPTYDFTMSRELTTQSGAKYGPLTITSYRKGNETRYLSHNCCSNAKVTMVMQGSHGPGYAVPLFTASRKILAGEELSIDYFYPRDADCRVYFPYCMCGYSGCRYTKEIMAEKIRMEEEMKQRENEEEIRKENEEKEKDEDQMEVEIGDGDQSDIEEAPETSEKTFSAIETYEERKSEDKRQEDVSLLEDNPSRILKTYSDIEEDEDGGENAEKRDDSKFLECEQQGDEKTGEDIMESNETADKMGEDVIDIIFEDNGEIKAEDGEDDEKENSNSPGDDDSDNERGMVIDESVNKMHDDISFHGISEEEASRKEEESTNSKDLETILEDHNDFEKPEDRPGSSSLNQPLGDLTIVEDSDETMITMQIKRMPSIQDDTSSSKEDREPVEKSSDCSGNSIDVLDDQIGRMRAQLSRLPEEGRSSFMLNMNKLMIGHYNRYGIPLPEELQQLE